MVMLMLAPIGLWSWMEMRRKKGKKEEKEGRTKL